MELITLIICVVIAWTVSTAIDSLTHLGQLLVPSPWLLGAIALIIATWIMRD